jgi:hypothetical protein
MGGEQFKKVLALLLMLSFLVPAPGYSNIRCALLMGRGIARIFSRDATESDPQTFGDGFSKIPNLIRPENRVVRGALATALIIPGLIDGAYNAIVDMPYGALTRKFLGKRKITGFMTEAMAFTGLSIGMGLFFRKEDEKKIKRDAVTYGPELDVLISHDMRMNTILEDLTTKNTSLPEARETALKLKEILEKYYGLINKINSNSLSEEEKKEILELFKSVGAVPAKYDELSSSQQQDIIDINHNLFYEYQAIWQFDFNANPGILPECFEEGDDFSKTLLVYYTQGLNGKKITQEQLKNLLMKEQYAKALERDLTVTHDDSDLPHTIRIKFINELKLMLKSPNIQNQRSHRS